LADAVNPDSEFCWRVVFAARVLVLFLVDFVFSAMETSCAHARWCGPGDAGA
jgi:hypothetical protein